MARGQKAVLSLPEDIEVNDSSLDLPTGSLVTADGLPVTVELTGNNVSVRDALMLGLTKKTSSLTGGLRKETIKTNKLHINEFLKFIDTSKYAQTPIESLPGKAIDEWEAYLLKSKTTRTAYQYTTNLLGILRYYTFYYAVDPTLFERIKQTASTDVGTTTPVPALTPYVERQVLQAADKVIEQRVKDHSILQERAANGSLDDFLLTVVNGQEVPRNRTIYRKLGSAGLFSIYSQVYLPGTDLLAFYIKLGLLTGWEPAVLGGLSRDCLGRSNGKVVQVGLTKYRRHGNVHYTTTVEDGGITTPGGLIRVILDLTNAAYLKSPQNSLWLGLNSSDFTIKVFNYSKDTLAWKKFVDENSVVDKEGNSVKVTSGMLRKTFKMHRYNESKGSLIDFVDGHSPDVAVKHYANLPQLTQTHEDAIISGVSSLVSLADGSDPNLEKTWLSSCKDINNSPFSAAGTPCSTDPWVCFMCPNSVISSINLPSIVAFVQEVEDLRESMEEEIWFQRFGVAYRVAVTSILPQFDEKTVRQASQEAVNHPVKLLIRSLKDGSLS